MAGTVTPTFSPGAPSKPDILSLAWISDATGNATQSAISVNGELLNVAFVPSASAVPTNAYAVTLKDAGGVDVLANQGAALSNTTATRIVPGVPFKDGTTTSTSRFFLADSLALSVSGAGNAKAGTLVLYLK